MFRTLPLLFAAMILSACSDGCGNTVVASRAAPDGRHRAILFERSCGATTGFSTQVSVLKEGQRLTGSGNTFTADDNHGAAVPGGWGGPWAEIIWRSPRDLTIRYTPSARMFRQEHEVDGVKVRYEAGYPD